MYMYACVHNMGPITYCSVHINTLYSIYHIHVHIIVLIQVLEMADVDFVEEDTMVFGASPCDKESGSGSGSEGQNQIMLG